MYPQHRPHRQYFAGSCKKGKDRDCAVFYFFKGYCLLGNVALQGGVHEAERDSNCGRYSKFKQYDPLTFVVTILNFLREDTALLLAPSGERPQTVEHPSPACPAVNGGRAGGWSTVVLVPQVPLNTFVLVLYNTGLKS